MSKLKPNQFLLGGHLITERPILFQTEMVKANMEDRKTQTRRGNGLKFLNDDPEYQKSITLMKMDYDIDGNKVLRIFRNGDVHNSTIFKSPYGKLGDLLWVRETWGHTAFDNTEFTNSFLFKADFSEPNKAKAALASDNWKPSIHMPKCFARIWAMVEEVRVERVQDISEENAIAEGLTLEPCPRGSGLWKNYKSERGEWFKNFPNPKDSFESLWKSINGEDSWNANPWVWVIKYRILSKTDRPDENTMLDNYLQITGNEAANV